MSDSIDQRIVEMRFDNEQFKKGVEESIQSLEKLDKALEMKDSEKSLSQLQKAADGISFDKMERSVDNLSKAFDWENIFKLTALQRVANKVIDAGERMIKSISVDQISAGMTKYEMKTKSVQQIIAATRDETESYSDAIERVEKVLERLNYYTDMTSYDFADMASNIGKFTSAGVDLETAERAMEGIANWAARSGQETASASRAMYNMSQALAAGKVKLIDWKSIENANMATKEFKETAIETAIELGTLQRVSDKVGKAGKKGTLVDYQSFASTLNESWFTSEVLIKTLEKYWYDEQTGMGTKLGQESYMMAKVALTFTQAMQAIKDSVSTGWMHTWQILFGNVEEAGNFFTWFCDTVIATTSALDEARNALLGGWAESGGKLALFGGFTDGGYLEGDRITGAVDYLAVTLKSLGTALYRGVDQVLNPLEHLSNYDGISGFFGNLPIYTENLENLFDGNALTRISQNIKQFLKDIYLFMAGGNGITGQSRYTVLIDIFTGIASVVDIGRVAISKIVGLAKKMLGVLRPTLDVIGAIGSKIGQFLYGLDLWLRGGSALDIFRRIWEIFKAIGGIINSVVKGVYNFFKGLVEGIRKTQFAQKVINGITKALDRIKARIQRIETVFAGVFEWLGKQGKAVWEWFEGIWDRVEHFVSNVKFILKPFAAFQGAFQRIGRVVKRVFNDENGGTFFERLKKSWDEVTKMDFSSVVNSFKQSWNRLKMVVKNDYGIDISFLEEWYDAVINWPGWKWIGEKIGSVWDWFTKPDRKYTEEDENGIVSEKLRTGFDEMLASIKVSVEKFKSLKIWDDLGNFFSGIWDSVWGFFTKKDQKRTYQDEEGFFLTEPITGFEAMTDGIKHSWKNIIGWEGWTEIGSFFTGIWDFFTKPIADSKHIKAVDISKDGTPIAQFRTGFEQVIHDIKESDLGTAISDAFGSVWDWFTKPDQAIWNEKTKEWSTGTGIEQMFQDLANSFEKVKGWPIWGEIGGLFAGIWDFFTKEDEQTGVTEFSRKINHIVAQISELADQIGLIKVWDSIETWWNDPNENGNTGFMKVFESIKSAYLEAKQWFDENVGPIVDSISGFFRKIWESIFGTFGQESLSIDLVATPKKLNDNFTKYITDFTSDFELKQPAYYLGMSYDEFMAKNPKQPGTTKDTKVEDMPGIVGFIARAINSIKTFWKESGLQAASSEISQFFTDLWNGVSKFFTEPDATTGKTGFISSVETVFNTVGNLLTKVKGWTGWQKLAPAIDSIVNSFVKILFPDTVTTEVKVNGETVKQTEATTTLIESIANFIGTTIHEVLALFNYEQDADKAKQLLDDVGVIVQGVVDKLLEIIHYVAGGGPEGVIGRATSEIASISVITELLQSAGGLLIGLFSSVLFKHLNISTTNVLSTSEAISNVGIALLALAFAMSIIGNMDFGAWVQGILGVGAIIGALTLLLGKLNLGGKDDLGRNMTPLENIFTSLIHGLTVFGTVLIFLKNLPGILESINKNNISGEQLMGLAATIGSVLLGMSALLLALAGASKLNLDPITAIKGLFVAAVGLYLIVLLLENMGIDFINGGVEKTIERISAAGQVIGAAMAALGDFIGSLIGGIGGGVVGGYEEKKAEHEARAMETIAQKLPGLVDSFQTSLNSMGDINLTKWYNLKDTLNGMSEMVQTLNTLDAMNRLEGIMHDLVTAYNEVGSNIGSLNTDNMNQVLEATSVMLSVLRVMKDLVEIGNQIPDESIWSNALKVIDWLTVPDKEYKKSPLQSIRDMMFSFYSDLQDDALTTGAVEGAADAIYKAYENAITSRTYNFKTAGGKTVEAIAQGIQDKQDLIIEKGELTGTNVLIAYTDGLKKGGYVKEEAKKTATETVKESTNIFESAGEIVTNLLSGKILNLDTLLTSNFDTTLLEQNLGKMIGSIASGFEGASGDIEDIKGIMSELYGAMGLSEDGTMAIDVTSITALSEGMTEQITIIKTNVELALKEVNGICQGYITKFVTVGKQFCWGLANGIDSVDDVPVANARVMAQRILDALEDELAIASPSKEAFAIGAYFALGLAEGISETEDPVVKAVEHLGDTVANTLEEKTESIFDIGKKNGWITLAGAGASDVMFQGSSLNDELYAKAAYEKAERDKATNDAKKKAEEVYKKYNTASESKSEKEESEFEKEVDKSVARGETLDDVYAGKDYSTLYKGYKYNGGKTPGPNDIVEQWTDMLPDGSIVLTRVYGDGHQTSEKVGLDIPAHQEYEKKKNTGSGGGGSSKPKTLLSGILDAFDKNVNYAPEITPVIDWSNVYVSSANASEAFRNANSLGFGTYGTVDVNSGFNTNGNADNSVLVGLVKEIRDLVQTLDTDITSLDVVLDTGTLAGSLAPKIDNILGRKTVLNGRGN